MISMLPLVYVLLFQSPGVAGWKLAEHPPAAYVGIDKCVRKADLLNYAEGYVGTWTCKQLYVTR